METRSESMINIELTKAEALLYMELIKQHTGELLAQIAEELGQAVTQSEMEMAAQENYKTNLESEAKKVAGLEAEIQSLRAQIDAKNLAANSNTFKARTKRIMPFAPWGLKKDGTPKKKPGGRAGI